MDARANVFTDIVNANYRTAAAALNVALSSSALFASPVAASAQERPPSAPDLLVVGGTPAGIAAAVTAARHGETVVLACAADELGGTLTGAMMDQWDLNLAPDGRSIQHGIFDEIYARLGDVFLPADAERTFAQMVAAEPTIDLVYDARPIAVDTTTTFAGRRIDGVTFRNDDTGALATYRAPNVIDATDPADVAALAGARYDVGRQDSGLDERTQAVTEMFTIAGVDWNALASSYEPSRDGAGGVIGRRAWGYANLMRDYRSAFANVVVRDLNLGLLPDGSVTVNAIDVTGIDGLDPRQLDTAKRETEFEAPRLLAYLRPLLPAFRDARVGIFAPDVYVRETRHIAGIERLTTQDVWSGRIPADSIGLASYPIDLHPVDPTDEPAYAPVRHVYGIPFGALVPKGLTNLLLAGPAISASHLASGSARVVPTTIEEGEADALATLTSQRRHVTFAAMSGAHPEVAARARKRVA